MASLLPNRRYSFRDERNPKVNIEYGKAQASQIIGVDLIWESPDLDLEKKGNIIKIFKNGCYSYKILAKYRKEKYEKKYGKLRWPWGEWNNNYVCYLKQHKYLR